MKNRSNWKGMLTGSVLTLLVLALVTPVLAFSGSRTVELRYDDIKLVVNGQTVTPRDGNGNIVEPFTIGGTTYLPVRALGTALDMDVSWNSRTNAVTLTSRSTPIPPDETGYIGLERARAIALEHAGLKASQVTFFKAGLDWENGRAQYEIEFYNGATEYDYDIDAVRGTILSWDHDVEGYQIPGSASGDYISLERAKELAQAKAPGAKLISCKLDREDGRMVYEGELRDGRTEYEFELDASTGAFLKWETDYDD